MSSQSVSGVSRLLKRAARSRRGAIIPLVAFMLIVMLAMMAFAIDFGFITLVRTDLQRTSDAAAFAGAGEMVNGTAAAQAAALSFLAANPVAGQNLNASNVTIEFGTWNSGVFTVTNNQPSAIRVVANSVQQPMFFGRLFGQNSFDAQAKSIAIYQPRDIGLVLDYSGSMAYDSQFRNISLLGQTAVENNLKQIYAEMGSPVYGTLGLLPVAYGTSSTSNSSVRAYFGLTSVAWPFPGGSWNEYIDYVQSDSYVNSAGYRNKYGYLTLVNYLMASNGSYAETPILKNCSEQPVTALKDAVDVFLSYLQAHETDDCVSLSIYTYSDGTAVLEQGLTNTYSAISSICRNRQAGHYVGGTNISAGMTKARVDLQNNGRTNAKKIMVVMTDGVVNLPTGNTTTDKAKVITEANLAAAANIPIVTISVGALADTALMQQVADITGGVAFVVPGGQPIANVKAQLETVFGQVAADRPLKLVQ